MARTRSASVSLARSTLVVMFSALACNAVLGIEDAHVDPTLGSGGATSAGSAGTGTEPKAGAPANSGGKSAGLGGSSTTSGGSSTASGGGGVQGGETVVGGASAGDTGQGGSSAGQGGEAGSGGAPGPGSLCAEYCDAIQAYCAGPVLQYRDRDQCMRVCEMFPQGVKDGPDGNTVACRLKYANKAKYAAGPELANYCRPGGPGGNGTCGANCDGFCAISMATCTPAISEYHFATTQECLTTCRGLPDIPYIYGDISVADGNSVECRLFHVASAAMADPEEHCAHVMGITLCEK